MSEWLDKLGEMFSFIVGLAPVYLNKTTESQLDT